MDHIELRSRVGPDGILSFTIPLGTSEANREVKIIVEASEPSVDAQSIDLERWKRVITETAGCISDPSFVRPEQGIFEIREKAFP
jgi:hypothetical protein